MANQQYELTINHMYSKSLNIYGDLGNIISLKRNGTLHGITMNVVNTEINGSFQTADIYFIGGGQDQDQMLVYKDLQRHKDAIKAEVEKGKVFLLICGGYQLFGKFFVDGEGNKIEGLGILDIETKALDSKVESRCIGNAVVEINQEMLESWNIPYEFSNFLVGFENHGGQTKLLSESLKPLGKVIVGSGNNSHDKLEGCLYKNIIGSYLHGSLLPKNPHLCEAIIRRAMQNKYVTGFEFPQLAYDLEKKAHTAILKMASL